MTYQFVLMNPARDLSVPEHLPDQYHKLTVFYNIEPMQVGGFDEPSYGAYIDEIMVACDDKKISWDDLEKRFGYTMKAIEAVCEEDWQDRDTDESADYADAY